MKKNVNDKKNSVNVLGTKYNINYFDYLTGYLGSTDTDKKIIDIDNTLNKNEFKRTILHELLHAYFYECGLERYSGDEFLIHWLDRFIPIIMQKVNKIKK